MPCDGDDVHIPAGLAFVIKAFHQVCKMELARLALWYALKNRCRMLVA
jgi:hypothetical protein